MFCDRTPCNFAISLDHNKNKVDLCPHLLDSAWLPAQLAHTTLIKSLRLSHAIFWHLNVRILELGMSFVVSLRT